MTRRSALILALAVSSSAALVAQTSRPVETFDAAWRIVRDSHFDPAMNGVDWQAIGDELRPRAAAARTDGELRTVIKDMLGRLGQSHFGLIPSTANTPRDAGDLSGDPGFEVRVVGRDVLVTSVSALGGAAAAGVKPGWKLAAIEGQPIATVLSALPETKSERLAGVEAWRIVESRIRGPQGSQGRFTFEDESGRAIPLQVHRRREEGQAATVGNLPTMYVRVEAEPRRTPAGATAGVIRFNVWMPAVDGPFAQAVDRFRGADGIVLDLRGNPGGLAAMLMGISGHFFAERKSLGVMKTRDNELRFFANPRLVNAAGVRVQPFAGPLAILVDALSGSASECFAGGMQGLRRARVFGQISMGQALPALFDRLPNGDVLIHAYGDFVAADGTRLEGRGVVPDEIVPLLRGDLLAGRDAPLERALAWMDRARQPGQGAGAVAPGRNGLINSTNLRPRRLSSPSNRK